MNLAKIRSFIIILLYFTCLNVSAERIELYNSDHMSSSLPYCITQDSYGYIWVGTTHGLNRYDGYDFLKYYYDDSDQSSISDNDIVSILCDQEKRLWVGTNTGLCRYEYSTNNFVRYPIEGIKARISCICQRKNGDILVGTAGHGLYVIPKGTDKLTEVKGKRKYSYDIFYEKIFEDDKGVVWCATHLSTITKCRIEADKFIETKEIPLNRGKVSRFLKTDNSGFLICCYRGILRYDYATKSIGDAGYDLSDLPANTDIISAFFNSKGSLGIGTSDNGYFCTKSGSYKLVRPEWTLSHDMSSFQINDLFSDKNGTSWLSCYHQGIIKASLISNLFQTYDKAQFESMQIDERLSTMTSNSMSKLQNSLNGIKVETAVRDAKGINYISEYGKGLVIYNATTGSIERLSMYQKNRKGGYLTNDWIASLYIDSHNMLWCGTANGVSCMDIKDRVFTKYGWNEILKERKCTAIGEDEMGNILLGTDQGLYIYNRKENRVSEAPHSKALKTLIIFGFQCDKDNDIWISTSMGLWHWSRDNDEFVAHINGSGLVAKEYLGNSSFHFTDGRIGFGTNKGITVFNPNEVKHSVANLGKVFLSSILVGNNIIGCTDTFYKLKHDNSFVLKYSLFNFQDNDDITFQYRINNSDEWTSIPEGTNDISFNRMEPGTYEIEVRAFCNGVYSSENCITTIKITPPWYLSIWAIVMYVLIIAGIITAISFHRERKRKADLDEQKMQFLINATHDIRSPLTLILGPLKKLKSRINDPEGKSELETIDHNAQRLLTLVNQILDERKIDKNQMHLRCQETDIVEFVRKICHLYDFNARERGISFGFQSDEKTLLAWIDHTNFDKVVNNIISNAFKYTFDGGEINVKLHKGADKKGREMFILEVIDNGLGLQEEQPERLFERFYQGSNTNEYKIEGTGIGLNLSQSLVRLHGGDITASNRSDGIRGSVFSISVPLGSKHLKPEEIITIEQEPTVEATIQKKRQANRNLRILIADDDAEIAEYISSELSTWYRFTTVKNGREALNLLLSESYDLLISDIMMPLMDGIELLKNVKSNVNISDIPVVLLTSKSAIDYRLEGLRKGADAYISKPFDMEELHITIDNLVDNRRRLRGKFSGTQRAEGKVEEVNVKGNDDMLMEQIMECINKNLTDSDFNVEQLARELSISRAQLFRRMKEITGIPTSEFIRNLRLEQAARLLRDGKINVSQVAYSVGFNSQTHFSTLFKKHFGKTPTEYADKKQAD